MALNKPILFLCLLALTIIPIAQAQLGLINGLFGLIKIQGTLFCTANGNIGVNGASTPVFPNAQVQLQCGSEKTVVSTALTDASGIFSILLDPIQFLLSTVVNNCNLAVTTPLATCNATLPSVGGLLAPLRVISTTVLGLLNIITMGPVAFGPTN